MLIFIWIKWISCDAHRSSTFTMCKRIKFDAWLKIPFQMRKPRRMRATAPIQFHFDSNNFSFVNTNLILSFFFVRVGTAHQANKFPTRLFRPPTHTHTPTNTCARVSLKNIHQIDHKQIHFAESLRYYCHVGRCQICAFVLGVVAIRHLCRHFVRT